MVYRAGPVTSRLVVNGKLRPAGCNSMLRAGKEKDMQEHDQCDRLQPLWPKAVSIDDGDGQSMTPCYKRESFISQEGVMMAYIVMPLVSMDFVSV